MGNSFIEDLIRSIEQDDRFSAVEKKIIANRLLPPPTVEERERAYFQVYPPVEVIRNAEHPA